MCVFFRQHALMQNAGNEDTAWLAPEEDDMFAMFHAMQSGANVSAGTSGSRVVGKRLAARFKIIEILYGLAHAPGAKCICADVHQVGRCEAGQTECGHRLTLFPGKFEFVPNVIKGVCPGDPAGIALINGGLECCKFHLVAPFVALKGSKRRADDFTGVFVTTTLYLRQHETVKLGGQIHISGRHDLFLG